ncbi:hypothetical protein J1614_011741 [Plenodomus biglobosus]|nr:hypothetical protein J1614_011741 [Plenodomus biglobosus]
MFTPDLVADSPVEVFGDSGSEEGRNEIDKLYRRHVLVDPMEREDAPPTLASAEGDNEHPRRLLAEIEEAAAAPSRELVENNPKLMLAKLDRELSSTRRNVSSDEHDLDELRLKLRETFGPLCNESYAVPTLNDTILMSTGDDAIVSTTNATGPGLDECAAEAAAKNAMIQRATQELDDIIQNTLEAEKRHKLAEEKERLPCRLIISNVAAGAEEEDVLFFFRSHAYDIRDLKFLEMQDPVKRTKTVQLDMWTRRAAVMASYMYGSIFGLILDIKMAVATTE